MKEGDIVIGKVKDVTNTITSVELEDGSEATIVSSEIAPGRIKHMRQFVVQNKTIVCKILGISGNRISLSLRRVNSKEKKEMIQKFKQKQAITIAFNQILKENAEKIKEKILKDYDSLATFIEAIRGDKKIAIKYIDKEKLIAIQKIADKKKKNHLLHYIVEMKCFESDGIKKIKNIFDLKNKNMNLTYISAGKFKLSLTVENFKQGKKDMIQILEEIEKKSKKLNCEYRATEER
jgi:translation initiation factor 2 alpha subunit (eIF-2alpha)